MADADAEPDRSATLTAVIARAAMARPDHPWVVTPDARLTYGEADRAADALAAGFAAQGVAQGDVVLTMLPDCLDVLTGWIALARLGAADVPVNVHYRGDILVHVIQDSAARIMVVDASMVTRLVEVAERLTVLERLVVRGPVPEGLPWPAIAFDDLRTGMGAFAAHRPQERDLLSIMYTSGTTGPSKGVMISHTHAYHYATATVRLLEMQADDVVYSAGLPLFHVAGRWGVFLAAAIVGASVAMPAQFSATAFWPDIRQHGATKVFLLGAMGSFLAQQPPGEIDRGHGLRKAILAPLLKDSRAFADRFGITLAHAFGATEFNTPILLDDATDASDPTLVGTVRDDLFEVDLFDDDDNSVPVGTIGELVVRPRKPWITTLGYWRHPEWTAQAWRNLWFHSGDLGRKDAEGRFYFVDRKKDSIRRRGENISSMEVEGVVLQFPAVQECAVFPVASAATEQEVMVAIVTRDPDPIDPVALVHFLAERMPHFMVPRYIEQVDALPRTPTGKIQKAELRERGLSARTWDREAAGIKVRRG